MDFKEQFDVIVVGGGHAGAEAAWAGSNLGARVALISMEADKIGAMSCNPAIGGLAKGQIVREIDAMGGLMGLAIDATGIQFKVLNQSKGPAVHGPRAQADKYAYAGEVQRLIGTRENITIFEGIVDDIVQEGGKIVGVKYADRKSSEKFGIGGKAVIVTTGTFMKGLMHTGELQKKGGRVDEQSAETISDSLARFGLDIGRLKTGTPPRLDVKTLDIKGLETQGGDVRPTPFSDMTMIGGSGDFIGMDRAYEVTANRFPVLEQIDCWITHTNEKSHDLIRANLHRAPMYNGQIDNTAGPRYCPSIEDKVVRFEDRTSHHVYLEPESLHTDEVYCNGISTSLPKDVQEMIVKGLPGCEKAKFLKYGYAVEYDMVWPHQIDATCMTKKVEGLFLAGQINGTSGYEEAGGQGLVAGLNAVRLVRGESLVRLRRDQAYIGVMMDDLVTKTPREPYRMFTSRAEYRLLLRSDNAAERLTPLGRELGLVDDYRWGAFENRSKGIAEIEKALDEKMVGDVKMRQWVRRPEVGADDLVAVLGSVELREAHTVVAGVQYAGYIARQERELAKMAQMDDRELPMDFDFGGVTGLRGECAAVLNKFRPLNFGQASRLAGVTPADMMLLSVALG